MEIKTFKPNDIAYITDKNALYEIYSIIYPILNTDCPPMSIYIKQFENTEVGEVAHFRTLEYSYPTSLWIKTELLLTAEQYNTWKIREKKTKYTIR